MRKPTEPHSRASSWQSAVAQKIESLRHGVVHIIVHDVRVIQIEGTGRVRIPPAARNFSRYQE